MPFDLPPETLTGAAVLAAVLLSRIVHYVVALIVTILAMAGVVLLPSRAERIIAVVNAVVPLIADESRAQKLISALAAATRPPPDDGPPPAK